MKIILIKDHKDLGKSGDLINAKDGYARNFLIPMKIAIEATKENLAKWQEEKRIEEENEKENRKQALELKKKLESKKILIRGIHFIPLYFCLLNKKMYKTSELHSRF